MKISFIKIGYFKSCTFNLKMANNFICNFCRIHKSMLLMYGKIFKFSILTITYGVMTKQLI